MKAPTIWGSRERPIATSAGSKDQAPEMVAFSVFSPVLRINLKNPLAP